VFGFAIYPSAVVSSRHTEVGISIEKTSKQVKAIKNGLKNKETMIKKLTTTLLLLTIANLSHAQSAKKDTVVLSVYNNCGLGLSLRTSMASINISAISSGSLSNCFWADLRI
jgi:hypothetical protein